MKTDVLNLSCSLKCCLFTGAGASETCDTPVPDSSGLSDSEHAYAGTADGASATGNEVPLASDSWGLAHSASSSSWDSDSDTSAAYDDWDGISDGTSASTTEFALMQANLHTHLGSTSRPTLLQEVYYRGRWKQQCHITDEAMKIDLARNAALSDRPDIYPRSLYFLKKLVGVRPLTDFEYHVCVKEHHVFDKQDPKQWCIEDTCPECGEPRLAPDKFGKLTARKRFWYLGLQNVVHQLFADRVFCKLGD